MTVCRHYSSVGGKLDRARTAATQIDIICRRIIVSSSLPVALAVARCVRHHILEPFEGFLALCSAKTVGDSTLHLGYVCDSLEVLSVVKELTTIVEQPSTTSADIISTIQDELAVAQQGTLLASVMSALWSDVSFVYSCQIHRWLQYGETPQYSSDFFIVRKTSQNDDGTIEGTFYVEDKCVPNFISAQSASNILFTGCVLRRISTHQNDSLNNTCLKQPASALKNLEQETITPSSVSRLVANLSSTLSRVGLATEAASIELRNSASNCLAEVMSMPDLQTYLTGLRGFLLLGNERFWFSFLRKLRRVHEILDDVSTPCKREAAERCLSRVFDLSVADADPGNRAPCIMALSPQSDGELKALLSVPFPVTAIIGHSHKTYGQMFSMAFKVRQMSHDLQRCCGALTTARRNPVLSRSSLFRRNISPAVAKLLVIRWQMSKFFQSYDDYLQMDVFEIGFRKLSALVQEASTARDASRKLDLDELVRSHEKVLDAWIHRSMIDSDVIQRRLHDICITCKWFCHLVHAVVFGGPVEFANLERIETDFFQSVALLLRVLASLSSRLGTQHVSTLLLRLDYNEHYYRK